MSEDLLAELRGLAARANDLTPAFEAIADDWQLLQDDMFSSEGGPVGGWDPLSPGYAARKRGGQLLVDEGDLFEALTSGTHRHSVRRVSDEGVEVGVSNPAAALHERGTSSMPARPVMPPEQVLEQRWIPLLEGYMAGGEAESLGL